MGQESHPLHRAWKLWYDSPSTYQNNWELSLIPIATVRTVEDFFAMLHFMKPLHAVRTFAQFHFFQEGVKPMWEDSANKDGGKLWLNVEVDPKNESSDAAKMMDSMWEDVLMAIVGEVLEDATSELNDIMGVVLAKRKNFNRLSVWIRDAKQSEAIDRVKKCLGNIIPASYELTFTKHGEK